MCDKKYFIKASKDYKKIFKEGRRVKGPQFVLYSLERRNSGESPALGISVSKRVVKLATARNRIKRIIREYWRKRPTADLSYRKYVLVVSRDPCKAPNKVISEQIDNIFNKNIS